MTVPAAAGTYCLTTRTKQSNDFSGSPGNDFTRVGPEPCVTVVSAPLDHFGFAPIGGQQAGTPFAATVTAYDQQNNVKLDYTGGATFGLSGLHVSPSGFTPSYGEHQLVGRRRHGDRDHGLRRRDDTAHGDRQLLSADPAGPLHGIEQRLRGGARSR